MEIRKVLRAGLTKPSNEFNASAHMTPELQLRLMALAISGNDFVNSVFVQIAERAGLTPRGRLAREKENERFYAALRMTMASQERLAWFHEKLERCDRASVAAVIEAEEKLSEARKDLARLKSKAYEITLPDGRTTKVYRDGDKVRDDSGAIVNEDLIRPEDIPESCPTWQDRQEKENAFREAERTRREAAEYRERVDLARKRAGEGGLTEKELDAMERDLERMPDAVGRHYEAETQRKAAAEPGGIDTLRELHGTVAMVSDVKPSEPFRAAAAGAVKTPDLPDADQDFTRMLPSVSRPSPG